MKPEGVSSGCRGVFEALPGSSSGCSPTTRRRARAGCGARVGDLPGTAQQLHRFGAVVLDLHAVGPDEVVLIGLRLIRQKERSNRDQHVTRGDGVVRARVSRRTGLPLPRSAGDAGRLARPGFEIFRTT